LVTVTVGEVRGLATVTTQGICWQASVTARCHGAAPGLQRSVIVTHPPPASTAIMTQSASFPRAARRSNHPLTGQALVYPTLLCTGGKAWAGLPLLKSTKERRGRGSAAELASAELAPAELAPAELGAAELAASHAAPLVPPGSTAALSAHAGVPVADQGQDQPSTTVGYTTRSPAPALPHPAVYPTPGAQVPSQLRVACSWRTRVRTSLAPASLLLGTPTHTPGRANGTPPLVHTRGTHQRHT